MIGPEWPDEEGGTPLKEPPFHAGQLLRKFIHDHALKQAEVARRANMTPQTLSGILNRSSIQLETLDRLSLTLGHDFFKDLSELLAPRLAEHAGLLIEPQERYLHAPMRVVIEVDPNNAAAVELLKQLAQITQRPPTPLP